MTDDEVRRKIEALEGCLARDDPALLSRFRSVDRGDTVAVVAVFVLVGLGAVLLSAGFAALSWVMWAGGAAGFAAAGVVDAWRRRRLGNDR